MGNHLIKASRARSGTRAAAITLDGVSNPAGIIPYPILLSGTIARIPRWEETSFDDHLQVFWFQNGQEELIYENKYPTGIVPAEVTIPITAARMLVDGQALIYYIVTAFEFPDRSPQKPLIIDHTQRPIEPLPRPGFSNLDIYGYYTCGTRPVLTAGIHVNIPVQTLALEGDRFSLEVQGFRSINGYPGEHDEHVVPEAKATYSRDLSIEEIDRGFAQFVEFVPCIKPLIDNDSMTAIYTLARNGKIIGRSMAALARVDRVIPGNLPCYV
jgi:hypothetical protein